MDPAAFGKACGAYFSKHGWSNATLDDLIEALNDAFKAQNHDFTLFDWKEEWICKAGMNEVIAEWNPNDENNEAVLRIK